MLSIDIKHPESDKFIDAKLAEGKVTGANVSVKINDDFMNSVKSGEPYYQIYPTNSTDISIDESSEYDNLIYCNDKWKCYKKIDAKKLWDKIIYNAWRSAEPGVLFWDNILNNTSVKPYYDKGFKPMSTNPCGEIPLQPYDSCRLLALNLYSFVNNPFTPSAEVDWDKLESEVRMAVRMLDDIVDLELEKVQAIIDKIKSDPEPESIKRVELELWEKVYKAGEQGRRLGLGTTGDGDALAALNKIYGTEDGNNTLINIHRFIAVVAYMESIDLAEERGSFEIFDYELEKDNEFINRVINSIPEYFNDDKYSEYKDKWKTYGRRNIACLTIAPTGSVSMMTQTSSGFEPVFSLFYQRFLFLCL
jgi:ribonucleoside-diphosphate reductase alpha chain